MSAAQPPAASARLFLALCPGPEEQTALGAHVATWQWPAQASRYAPADWHLTLHFIGAVPLARLAEWQAGLAVPMSAFTLPFGQAELWPHGLAVLLPTTIPEPLQQLHARLAQALQRLDLKIDPRPFRPHVTLARHAPAARPPAAPAAFSWRAHGYALMAATGQPRQRYQVLQHYEASA